MLGALLALVIASASAPTTALAYGWPLKPFDRPHPIRGYFGDPRVDLAPGELSRAFHFGVDIAAPDGTRVYAVEAGTVSGHDHSVAVTAPDGGIFGYWHIVPRVDTGDWVSEHQLIGRIAVGWGHVHFAELGHGEYVNPLRVGGLEPFVDRTPPTISSLLILSKRRSVDFEHVAGIVDLEVDAYDVPEPEPPGVWSHSRVTPALVRWRVTGAGGDPGPWHVAFDTRSVLLPDALFGLVYAPGTRQNRASRPGRYLFYLEQGWDTRSVPNGVYVLEVLATDLRGNTTRSELPFRVANAPATT